MEAAGDGSWPVEETEPAGGWSAGTGPRCRGRIGAGRRGLPRDSRILSQTCWRMSAGVVAARWGGGLLADLAAGGAGPTASQSQEQLFAGQLRYLPDPSRHELLVELVVLVEVVVARLIVLGLDRGTGRSDVPRKKVTLT